MNSLTETIKTHDAAKVRLALDEIIEDAAFDEFFRQMSNVDYKYIAEKNLYDIMLMLGDEMFAMAPDYSEEFITMLDKGIKVSSNDMKVFMVAIRDTLKTHSKNTLKIRQLYMSMKVRSG